MNKVDERMKVDQLSVGIIKTIALFLQQGEAILLSQVSSLLRSSVLSAGFWDQLTIQTRTQNWKFETKWIGHHSELIRPRRLSVYVSVPATQLLFLLSSLLCKVNHLEQLRLVTKDYEEETEEQIIEFFLIQCGSLRQLVTNIVTNRDLIKTHLKHLEHLEIINQSASLQQTHILSLPKVKHLVVKPYQVDFAALTGYLKECGGVLQELELDCEEYPSTLFNKMLLGLDPLVMTQLRLYHLENISNETLLLLKNYPRLTTLCLTKTLSNDNTCWRELFECTNWIHLRELDLTEATLLEDTSLAVLFDKSRELRGVTLSWCTRVSNYSINTLIQRCELLEELVVVGLKRLDSEGFQPFIPLFKVFDEKRFHEIKKSLYLNRFTKYSISDFFGPEIERELKKPTVLKKLQVLNCQSCDSVGDNMLRVISLLRGRATVCDYYGNRMGLMDFERDNSSR